tara:strand:+ start:943 stop:1368 length:426 start_codon:yes stop_codon:yes gene_type:complete
MGLFDIFKKKPKAATPELGQTDELAHTILNIVSDPDMASLASMIQEARGRSMANPDIDPSIPLLPGVHKGTSEVYPTFPPRVPKPGIDYPITGLSDLIELARTIGIDMGRSPLDPQSYWTGSKDNLRLHNYMMDRALGKKY